MTRRTTANAAVMSGTSYLRPDTNRGRRGNRDENCPAANAEGRRISRSPADATPLWCELPEFESYSEHPGYVSEVTYP